MGAQSNRDFASLLDELLVATDVSEDAGPRPTIPFDYLAVAEELHSGRITVSNETAAAEYKDAGSSLDAELSAFLDVLDAHTSAPAPEPLPSIEPDIIALELGLADIPSADLGSVRRRFAFANHPDRVAPHLRQRALTRMQVANCLIDEARHRALATAKR